MSIHILNLGLKKVSPSYICIPSLSTISLLLLNTWMFYCDIKACVLDDAMRTDANDELWYFSSFRNREVRCTTVSWKEGKKNALNGVYDWIVIDC